MQQILDANINRVTEGLRVIEEYVRFAKPHKPMAMQVATLRSDLAKSESQDQKIASLKGRDVSKDMRAYEAPNASLEFASILRRNFKRVEEGLRALEEYSGDPIYNKARYDVYMLEKDILLWADKPSFASGIYLISDDPDILEQGLTWKVALIQLRDKTASKATLYNKAKGIASKAKRAGIPFIVNDFIDISIAVDADGLHTGQDDLPLPLLRAQVGHNKILGRSTHSLEQGKQAERQGADYVSVGPIWETPSKPGRDAIGFDYLKVAQHELKLPFVAIGGINTDNIDTLLVHQPPLVGLIREYETIPLLQKKMMEMTHHRT